MNEWPKIGDRRWNSNTKSLMVWTGQRWEPASPEVIRRLRDSKAGIPMSEQFWRGVIAAIMLATIFYAAIIMWVMLTS
jgi:hypothetical protein